MFGTPKYHFIHMLYWAASYYLDWMVSEWPLLHTLRSTWFLSVIIWCIDSERPQVSHFDHCSCTSHYQCIDVCCVTMRNGMNTIPMYSNGFTESIFLAWSFCREPSNLTLWYLFPCWVLCILVTVSLDCIVMPVEISPNKQCICFRLFTKKRVDDALNGRQRISLKESSYLSYLITSAPFIVDPDFHWHQ